MNDADDMTQNIDIILQAICRGVRCCIITGAAGTGKTTCIFKLREELCNMGRSVVLLAPTGRAAKVLQRRTNHSAYTIHSHIYCIENAKEINDEKEDTMRIYFPLKSDRPENKVFIVDESSMVGLQPQVKDELVFGSGSLLGDLLDYADLRNEHCSNTVIFVGDSYQLPPVGEGSGCPPALDVRKLESRLGFTPFRLELTKVYRQTAESGILKEARKLRSALDIGRYQRLLDMRPHEDVKNITADMLSDFYSGHPNLDDCMTIAWKNETVRGYNRRIRKALGIAESVLIARNERLLCLNNTRYWMPEKSNFCPFMNGEFFEVVEPSEKVREVEGFTQHKGEKVQRFIFRFRKLEIRRPDEPESGRLLLWVNCTLLEQPSLFDNRIDAFSALYHSRHKSASDWVKKMNPDIDAVGLETRVENALLEDSLLHAPWVTYGYAITGHKSQGGEWKHVFADYSHGNDRGSDDYVRWAYTVTTRAQSVLYTMNTLTFRPPSDDTAGADAPVNGSMSTEIRTDVPNSKSTLIALLQKMNIAVTEVKQFDYRWRVFLKGEDGDMGVPERIDLCFRKDDRVNTIQISPENAEMNEKLAALLGMDVSEVLAGCEEMGGPTASADKIPAEVNPEDYGDWAPFIHRMAEICARNNVRIIEFKDHTPTHAHVTVDYGTGNGICSLYRSSKKGPHLDNTEKRLPDSVFDLLKDSFVRE